MTKIHCTTCEAVAVPQSICANCKAPLQQDDNPAPVDRLRVAAEAAEREIRRLHKLFTPEYEGKIGEPKLLIADDLRAALAASEGSAE